MSSDSERPVCALPNGEISIGSPFDDTVFDVGIDDRVRANWAASGIVRVRSDVDDVSDPKGIQEGWWVTAHIGDASYTRRTANGQVAELETVSLELTFKLHDPPQLCRLHAVVAKGEPDKPIGWNATLTSCVHLAVRALASGEWPPRPPRLATKARPNDAAALLEIADAATVFSHITDEWDLDSARIDLARLGSVLRGELADESGLAQRWAMRLHGAGASFVAPLVIDSWKLQFAHMTAPRWLSMRHWLALEANARGNIVSLEIRTDRNVTFDAEDADDAPWGTNAESMGTLLGELGYSAALHLIEGFLAPADDFDDEEET
jgi:hypothetical protein